uniref:Uncharacterized protein n=1 Tax=Ixodes ricinus TaxID=34613 RepID=A0A6B0TZZ5_IXORI
MVISKDGHFPKLTFSFFFFFFFLIIVGRLLRVDRPVSHPCFFALSYAGHYLFHYHYFWNWSFLKMSAVL